MSTWTNGVYTERGISLLAKLTQGASLKVTRAVAGAGYVDPAQLANQTAISDAKWELKAGTASYPEKGVCKLPLVLTNKGVGTSFTAKQIGLYANDPDNGEILFFITQSSSGTPVPAEASIPSYSSTWTFYFRYGQANNVEITVSPADTVSPDELNDVRNIAQEGVSLTENGSSIIVADNTAELPFVGLSVMGKSTQNGIPSPSAPVDIEGVGNDGDISVSVYGENLVDANALNSSEANANDSISVTENGYKIVAVGGGDKGYTSTSLTLPLELFRGKNIVLKADSITNTQDSSGRGGNAQITINTQTTQSGKLYKAISPNNLSVSFNVPDDASSVSLGIYTNNSSTALAAANTTTIKGLVIAYSDIDWVPYKAAQTVSLSTPNGLHGVPVQSGGNYTDASGQQWICDEIDLTRGVYIQRIEAVECTTLNQESLSTVVPLKGVANNRLIGTDTKASLCTITDKYDYTREDLVHFCIENTAVWVFAPTNYDYTDNPPVVYAAMQTPVETALSVEETEKCRSLHSNNPITVVFNDSGANMVAECIKAQHENALDMVLRSIGDSTVVTLSADQWTLGDDGRYSQTVNVPAVKQNTKIVIVDVALSGTDIAADAEYLNAWKTVSAQNIAHGDGTLTFHSATQPTINIPVNVGVV